MVLARSRGVSQSIDQVGCDTEHDARYSIRGSHLERALSERMKVFEEFVSMFDAADTSI